MVHASRVAWVVLLALPAFGQTLPANPKLVFSPATSVTIDAARANGVLCLQSGQYFEMRSNMPNDQRAALIQANNIDAYLFTTEPDFMFSLPTADAGVVLGKVLDAGAWDTLSAAAAQGIVDDMTKAGQTGTPGANSDSHKPVVLLVRTRRGTVSLVRLTGHAVGEQTSVSIEIKTVQAAKQDKP